MSIETEPSAEDLLEPLEAYRKIYRDSFKTNCEKYYDGLVKASGVDAEANRLTVKSYNDHLAQLSAVEKLLAKNRGLKGFFIFLIVLGAILMIAGIFLLVGGSYAAGGGMLAVGAVFVVLFPIILAVKTIPIIKNAEQRRDVLRQKADALKQEAYAQMVPLNSLFEGNQFKQLVEKTVPLIKIDENFNVHRYDYLNGKYGYGETDDPEISTLGILSGEILGNPFVEERQLIHSMGSCTYTGSIVISWTTQETDAEGHVHTEYHTETLTASVVKPKPYYSRQTRLVYANEAAPDLHFSRRPSHADDLTEGQRERKVKRGMKKIRKMRQKAVETSGSFTEMGNAEFDVLFGALDRDNEVQFRLLFTPLAQKNLLALMTDNEGFGDDFAMRKSGCLNYISSEHSAGWEMDDGREQYMSYSVDLSREKFLSVQQKNFANLYFDLAPLLSIPLYQQRKPREYIYRESYAGNYTRQEAECAVNRMAEAFSPFGAVTESILKTSVLKKNGKSDCVSVTAYAYEGIPRTDYVAEWGGDGCMHEVPVNWIEYIPIERERTVCLKELGLSDRDFESEVRTGRLKGALDKRGSEYSYGHGIFCCVSDETDEMFDSEFTLKS